MTNRAKTLLDRFNNEFNLVPLSESIRDILDRTTVREVLVEMVKITSTSESEILKETIAKLKATR